jgi:hypothetical protein
VFRESPLIRPWNSLIKKSETNEKRPLRWRSRPLVPGCQASQPRAYRRYLVRGHASIALAKSARFACDSIDTTGDTVFAAPRDEINPNDSCDGATKRTRGISSRHLAFSTAVSRCTLSIPRRCGRDFFTAKAVFRDHRSGKPAQHRQ